MMQSLLQSDVVIFNLLTGYAEAIWALECMSRHSFDRGQLNGLRFGCKHGGQILTENLHRHIVRADVGKNQTRTSTLVLGDLFQGLLSHLIELYRLLGTACLCEIY